MKLADVRIRSHGVAVVAAVAGEVDLSNTKSIGSTISERTPNQAHVVVLDLTDTDYLDSAGIQLIYGLRESLRARGQALALVIPPESPSSDALKLAGVAGHIDTSDTLGEALARYGESSVR